MLECGLRAVVLHNKEVVWNYYAEFTADCRRINTNSQKTPEIQYGIAYIDANEKAITSSKVTFKNEFTDIPLVVCSIRSSTTNPKYGCISAFADHDDITSKGFTIKVANNADEILFPAVAWIAVCKRR